LIKEVKVSEAKLDEAVRRVLLVKHRLGLFEHPYADEDRESIIFSREHLAAVREGAVRSMVLLINDHDLLPLSKETRSIAVIGPLADDSSAPLGSWVGDGRKVVG
jgi:beta-glucosidase